MKKHVEPFTVGLEQVNNLVVTPYENLDCKYPVFGQEILADYLSHRIAIAGPSETGKTVLLVRILEKIVHPDFTRVFLFSTTGEKDPVIKEFLVRMYYEENEDGEFEKKHDVRNFEINKSIYHTDPETGKTVNLLNLIRDMFDEEPMVVDGVQIAKSVIVFDDFTKQLKYLANELDEFTKTLRHLKSVMIMCFHDLIDIPKTIRQEVTMAFLFSGFSKQRFVTFLEQMGFHSDNFSIEQIYEIYKNKTFFPTKHDFIYINKRSEEIRINLNTRITP